MQNFLTILCSWYKFHHSFQHAWKNAAGFFIDTAETSLSMMQIKEKIMKTKLTIFMINNKNLDNSEIVKTDNTNSEHKIYGLPEIQEATLYVKQASEKRPNYTNFFNGHVAETVFGTSISPGSTLVVRMKEATFVITFGQGRHLIFQENIVLDFGLKVVLNSVEPAGIRSLDKTSNGKTPLHSRNQGLTAANIFDLLFDSEQDAATAITGMSKHQHFGGAIIEGRDSFSITTNTGINDLHVLLKKIYSQYQSSSYKKDFAFIDNIQRVRCSSQVEQLNNELVFRLDNDLGLQACHLSPPQIIDWDTIDGFAYLHANNPPSSRTARHSVLCMKQLHDYFETKGEAITLDGLRKLQIASLDSNFNRIASWSAYKCLYAEIRLDNAYYIFRNGCWYNIEENFVVRINHIYQQIPRYEISLPAYSHKNEGEYNKHVAKTLDDSFCMDAKNIMYGGGHSKIEFCDVVIQKTDLMHMKRGTNSSSLSHLFSQGVVSAQAFKDASFRRKLSMRLPSSLQGQSVYSEKPREDQFRVVYAITSDKAGELHIPFFSKVSLKNAIQELESMGYRTALAKIEIDDAIKQTATFKPGRKKAA